LHNKPVVRELAAFLFFTGLSLILTWPLAAHIGTAVSDFGDPLLVTFLIDWVCHAITHQPLALYDAPMFHPGILPLAYSENFIAPALLVLPFHLAGLTPVVVYNLCVLLGFALSGYGAWVLARMVSGSTIGALAGGTFFAFCSFKFDHLSHLQILFSAWVPLLLAAVLAYWERPNWKRGALVTLVLVANGLTNIYYLMYATVALAFVVVLLMIIRRRPLKVYAGLAVAAMAGVLLLYPFLAPYRTVSKKYEHVRHIEEVEAGSASWSNWLVPSQGNRLYGGIPEPDRFQAERQLFPGLAIVFLTLIALVATSPVPVPADGEQTRAREAGGRRQLVLRWSLDLLIFALLGVAWATTVANRVEWTLFGKRILAAEGADVPLVAALIAVVIRFAPRLRQAASRSRFNAGAWAAGLWIVFGWIASLGTHTFLYTFFYRRLEPFQAMRVPARFAVVVYAGLAVWGALGVAALLRKREGWKRIAVAALVLAIVFVEVIPRIRWEHVPREVPPVYQWLAKTRVGPVVEIPFSGEGVDYRYLLGATTHRVKLVNGTSGFFPNEWWKLRHNDASDQFDPMFDDLERYGTRLLILHGDFSTGDRHAKIVAWLQRLLASRRLAFLGRFDNEIAGDYVFALTRNTPDWARYRLPDVPDGAGYLPAQNLARFFEGKPTHSDSITIWMDGPRPYETVRGPLRVGGWTMSPHGVRRVTVFLQNEKVRLDAQRTPRGDVLALYPSMRYLNPTPGFEVVVDKRPRGVPMETSLIVEVEDHGGRVRRGRHISFRWEEAE
jgi:hypothetical protein